MMKLIAVDDRYIAENYYNNQMDEVLYEKDGTISKMKQFDYKIHKFKRKSSEDSQNKTPQNVKPKKHKEPRKEKNLKKSE